MSNQVHSGSCLCGSVRYEISGNIEAVAHCHCSMCRKAHGAAYGTYAAVARADYAVIKGEELIRDYKSSPPVTRKFCSVCGSPLLWYTSAELTDLFFVPLGTLDTPYVPPTQRHIHVESKAEWHVIDDDWPQSNAY